MARRLGHYIAALDDIGLTQAKIDRAIGESVVIREAVIDKAKEVRDYWQSIAPVSDRPAHPLGKGGYIDEPGDYRDSITIDYPKHRGGYFTARVITRDPKAHWLEYGSIHNLPPKIGYAQKVVEAFGGATDKGVAGGLHVSARP